MSTKKFEVMPQTFLEQISDYQGKVKLDFLAPGYGHTIGNGLRRVLLSSIEGYAITAIKLPIGVMHEFDTIPGVIQDVSDIILNLKKIRFKKTGTNYNEKITVTCKNKIVLKAGELAKNSTNFEILNPDLVICTMDESANFELELKIDKGCGYVPTEHRKNNPSTNYIPIDAVFTPIKNVQYKVENTLVGHRIDYEKVIMEITTDGSISLQEALQSAATQLIDHFSLFLQKHRSPQQKETIQDAIVSEKNILIRKKLMKPLRDLGLSVRTFNSLKSNEVSNLGDIVKLTFPKLMRFRNFGKVSMTEVEELLAKEGLTLGMDTSSYSLEENIY